MTPLEKRVCRLERTQNYILFTAGLVALFFGGYHSLQIVERTRHRLSLSGAANGEIRLSAGSDGPFIATHLVRTRPGQAPFALVRLPEPVVFMESGSRTIPREETARLRWFDRFGEPVTEFYPDEQLQALYHRPQVTIQREKERLATASP